MARVAPGVKNLPASVGTRQEVRVRSLGGEEPPEKEVEAAHASILFSCILN